MTNMSLFETLRADEPEPSRAILPSRSRWAFVILILSAVGVHVVTGAKLVVNTAFEVRVRQYFRRCSTALAQAHYKLVFGRRNLERNSQVPMSSCFLAVGAMLCISQWEIRTESKRYRKALASDDDLRYLTCRILGRENKLPAERWFYFGDCTRSKDALAQG